MRPLRRALLLLVLLPLSASANGARSPPSDTAIAPGDETPLDRLIEPREIERPAQSAFRLLSEGPEAFVLRARSTRLAMRSLDIQTFIWRFDLTGSFLAHRVLQAADRGVRVRVLVDDMDARNNGATFAALAAHPNIAVRAFNPFASRRGMLKLIGEGLRDFDRVNRRMHNKTWIADNRMAIVGGRNLGDEYFDAADELNFVDLDFAMIGPIVRDASTSFDAYWSSPAAVPVESLDADAVNARALAALRIQLDETAASVWTSLYGDALLGDDSVQRFISGDWPMQWTAKYRFVADDPLKVTTKDRDPQRAEVRRTLLQAVQHLRSDLVLVSPYFVPGESITTLLADAVSAGKRVRVLTNSLVANDISAVHGGYSRYRKELLEGGIELWELKAQTRQVQQHFRTGATSLHTKGLLLDRKTLFVGSYNLDPRSAWLNCEQGVMVESEVLGREMMTLFESHISAQRAWKVTMNGGDVTWSDGMETFSNDPRSSILQRLQAWLVQVLRLEPQL